MTALNYNDFLILKTEFEEQKLLENYQKDRRLPRPKTNILIVFLALLLYIVIITVACLLFYRMQNLLLKFTLGTLFVFTFSDIYLRFLGIKLVECYQHYAKEETRRRCLCVPSCSEYAILCFKRYEFIHSLLKIRKRLYITCTGDDFKIDFPYQGKTKNIQ